MENKTLEQKLDESHILLITSKWSFNSMSDIIEKLLKWSNESSDSEINIYLSFKSQYFIDIMTVYDVLKTLKNPISVTCIGNVSGFGPVLLAAATKGKRYALKHSLISLVQPISGLDVGANQQTEIEIEAKETSRQRAEYEKILSESFNIPLEKVHQFVEEDKEFSSQEAKELGLIDEVLE